MTIKDIARLSGCGVATVSRVLNQHPDVSEETRRKVLAVVEENGFQPNNNAKHLKQQAGTSIAILVKGSQNMLFADLVERIQVLLREKGKDAVVYHLDEDANEVAYAIQLSRERKPVGFLFLGGDLEYFEKQFRAIRVPCVLLTNTAQGLGYENLSSLTTDDSAAAAQAIEYLIDNGHRKIGILGGNYWSSSQISYLRIQGCKRVFERRGIPLSAEQCEPCRFSMGDGYTATHNLLKRCPDLTAIFAFGDVMAIGVMRAIHDLGKRVPEDISVVGYDGLPVANYCIPRLTTIRQDTQELAKQGVEVLLRAIEHRQSGCVHSVVPFRLLIGESVARREL